MEMPFSVNNNLRILNKFSGKMRNLIARLVKLPQENQEVNVIDITIMI